MLSSSNNRGASSGFNFKLYKFSVRYFASFNLLVYTDMTDDTTLNYKRKINSEDLTHHKKLKCDNRMDLREELSNEELQQLSEKEGNLPELRSATDQNFKSQETPCKGFYVTFSDELSAERAVRLSGYGFKIYNNNEAPYNGTLSVDFAEPEFEQNYFKCSRDANISTNSLYFDTNCSEYKTEILIGKLKSEKTFYEALSEVIGILEENNCHRKNTIDLFYIMQLIHLHVLHLTIKKENFEQDNSKPKSDLVELIKETCKFLNDIENVFRSSQEKNNKRYFTKFQRKNIKLWARHCGDYKTVYMEELASYESNHDEQINQSEEDIVMCEENEVLNCNLENSDRLNEENHNQVGHLRPISPSPFIPYTDYAASLICQMLRTEERCTPFTPLPIHYTYYEASLIREKLSKEETFTEAANTLIKWLENEECSDENASSFISMIQFVHIHLAKLHEKKVVCEEIFKDAKKTLVDHFNEISCSLKKIELIYLLCSLEQCSNHFTSADRKIIELGIRYVGELNSDIKNQIREIKKELRRHKKIAQLSKELNNNIQKFKEQNHSLKCQLREVQNNIAIFKYTYKKDFERLDDELQSLHKDMQLLKKF